MFHQHPGVSIRLLTTTALFVLTASAAHAVEEAQVLTTYADIAAAFYGDSLITARQLQQAVQDPSANSLQMARNAWLAARVPYQQTEVFRFCNPIVDE